MTKKCKNPNCLADNPDNAKFCRLCGYAFNMSLLMKIRYYLNVILPSNNNDVFTLDSFSNINFSPKSISNIKFVNRFNLFFCIIFVLTFIILLNVPSYYYREVDDEFYLDGLLYYHQDYLISIIFVFFLITILFLINNIYNKIRYNLNADYIEEKFIGNQIVRIAKKSRLGLFNTKKKKVLLSSRYTNIEKFDNNHLLLFKGNLKGLYSLTYHKIIVPVKYESISNFINAVTTIVSKDGTLYHFDVKGNRLK